MVRVEWEYDVELLERDCQLQLDILVQEEHALVHDLLPSVLVQ